MIARWSRVTAEPHRRRTAPLPICGAGARRLHHAAFAAANLRSPARRSGSLREGVLLLAALFAGCSSRAPGVVVEDVAEPLIDTSGARPTATAPAVTAPGANPWAAGAPPPAASLPAVPVAPAPAAPPPNTQNWQTAPGVAPAPAAPPPAGTWNTAPSDPGGWQTPPAQPPPGATQGSGGRPAGTNAGGQAPPAGAAMPPPGAAPTWGPTGAPAGGGWNTGAPPAPAPGGQYPPPPGAAPTWGPAGAPAGGGWNTGAPPAPAPYGAPPGMGPEGGYWRDPAAFGAPPAPAPVPGEQEEYSIIRRPRTRIMVAENRLGALGGGAEGPGVTYEMERAIDDEGSFLPRTANDFHTLVRTLGEGRYHEQEEARLILVDMGPASINYLLGALESTKPGVRAHAVQALGDIGAPAVIDYVRPRLWDDSNAVRAQAMITLAKLGDHAIDLSRQGRDIWNALHDALGDAGNPSFVLRQAAILAVGIYGQVHPDLLARLVNDLGEPGVSDNARALARLALNGRYLAGGPGPGRYRDFDAKARSRWREAYDTQLQIHHVQELLLTVLAAKQLSGLRIVRVEVPLGVDDAAKWTEKNMARYQGWNSAQIMSQFDELEVMRADLEGLLAPMEFPQAWLVRLGYRSLLGSASFESQLGGATVFDCQQFLGALLGRQTGGPVYTPGAPPEILRRYLDETVPQGAQGEGGPAMDFSEDKRALEPERRRDYFDWGGEAEARRRRAMRQVVRGVPGAPATPDGGMAAPKAPYNQAPPVAPGGQYPGAPGGWQQPQQPAQPAQPAGQPAPGGWTQPTQPSAQATSGAWQPGQPAGQPAPGGWTQPQQPVAQPTQGGWAQPTQPAGQPASGGWGQQQPTQPSPGGWRQ